MRDDVMIRKFVEDDIPKKVEWINNPDVNKFLHYDVPISIENTKRWYDKIKDETKRLDLTIVYKDIPVGLLGLLNIEKNRHKAELYIAIGEMEFLGLGIASQAIHKLISHAFLSIGLRKVYLYTEVGNLRAQKLFEGIGFVREGLLRHDLLFEGRIVDRYVYGLLKEEYNGATYYGTTFDTRDTN